MATAMMTMIPGVTIGGPRFADFCKPPIGC